MKIHRTSVLRFLIVFIALIAFSISGYAQCPMCRSAVESGLMEEGNKVGIGLNDGILYLLATPYLIVLIVGTIWYRKFRKAR